MNALEQPAPGEPSPTPDTTVPAPDAHASVEEECDAPSPLLDRPGAVAAQGEWAGVAAHYGNPLREQRMLEEGLAAVDLGARGVVRISGPDRLTWLHSMTTQQLADLEPFVSVESLVLSPKGHVEFDLHLVDDGETTWITLDPGRAPELVAWLERMRFMLRVEIDDATQRYAVIGEPIAAPTTAQELAQRGVIAWVDPWPRPGPTTADYADVHPHPGEERVWRELVVPRERLVAEFGDRPAAGLWAAEALRILHWRPDALHEVDHRTIPHELDWLRTAVHLQKGCYRGQETIARVHNLGRPPRRLAFVHLDGSGHTLPSEGADVVLAEGERPVGRLTSVARHHVEGPVGLVVLKRSVPADAPLVVDGVAAAQTPIVKP